MPFDSSSLFRLTVTQYRRLFELGILSAGSPIELLEGLLIEGMPRNPIDNPATRTFEEIVQKGLPGEWQLGRSLIVALCESKPESAPEPDYVIVRTSAALDGKIPPRPTNIGVVIEIASSCPDLERVHLGRIYARAGVPVYWVFNFAIRIVEVFTQPSGPIDAPHYAKRAVYPIGTSVPVVLDGTTIGTIAVSDVMG